MRVVAVVAMLVVPALAVGQEGRFELFNECAPMRVVVDTSRAEGMDGQEVLDFGPRGHAGSADVRPGSGRHPAAHGRHYRGEYVAYARVARSCQPVRDPVTGITQAAPSWIGGGSASTSTVPTAYVGISILGAVAEDILRFALEYERRRWCQLTAASADWTSGLASATARAEPCSRSLDVTVNARMVQPALSMERTTTLAPTR